MSRRSAASSGIGSSTDPEGDAFAVILAGGLGTRLWPLARADRPKQFLSLFGRSSLFRLACDRILPLVPARRVLVVTRAGQERWLRRQAPEIPAANVIVEGMGRDTAASVGLAARLIRARHGEGTMIVLPADHWIEPGPLLPGALRRALRAARKSGRIVLVGVRPTAPESSYGYLKVTGREIAPGVRSVARFVEKPERARARRLLRAPGTLWNSGIFVARAGVVLGELGRCRPRITRALRAAGREPARGAWRVPAATMSRIEPISIDRAVFERSGRLLAVRGRFRWADLGTWRGLATLLERGDSGLELPGRTTGRDSERCAVLADRGLVILLEVRDLVVVKRGDVILIAAIDALNGAETLTGRLRRAVEGSR